jgi:hypothetical protein
MTTATFLDIILVLDFQLLLAEVHMAQKQIEHHCCSPKIYTIEPKDPCMPI